MKRRTIILSTFLLALALFAAAFTMPSRAAAQSESTIAAIVAENEDFSTLLTALEAAMLVSTFDGEDEFTVFAPTNAAFEALPDGALDALLEDPLGDLTDVLAYHVVAGAVPSTEVVQLESADTLNGASISIEVTDDGVILNDVATVTMVDIMASNGVIHVIDTVLLPPADDADSAEDTAAEDTAAEEADSEEADSAEDSEAEESEESEAAEEAETDGEDTGEGDAASQAPPIGTLVSNDPSFSTLFTALQTAGLTETLSTDGPFTVFAPTDDAFAMVPEADLTALLDDPEGALTDVLLYHVVAGDLVAEDLLGMESVDTVQGAAIALTATDDGLLLNDTVNVVVTDVMAGNGVIHVIDAVLLPPADTTDDTDEADMATDEEAATDEAATDEAATDEAATDEAATDEAATDEAAGDDAADDDAMEATEAADLPSIAEIVAADSNFSTLLAAVEAAGLAETLAGDGDFTVFAPTNDAFDALPDGFLDEVLQNKRSALERLLLYHVVGSSLGSADVVEMSKIATLNGTRIMVTVTEDGVFLNDTIQVVMTDVQASNGIIHVIDGVLVPPGLQKAPYYEQDSYHMMAPKHQPYQPPSHAQPPMHKHPHKHPHKHGQHHQQMPPRCYRQ